VYEAKDPGSNHPKVPDTILADKVRGRWGGEWGSYIPDQ